MSNFSHVIEVGKMAHFGENIFPIIFKERLIFRYNIIQLIFANKKILYITNLIFHINFYIFI